MKFNFTTKKMAAGFCLFSILGLAGCATSDMKELVSSGNAMSTTSGKLTATNPNQVKIYDIPPAHYQVVGRISADNYNLVGMEYSQASLMTELKKQAASVGGNGIINITPGMANTTAEAVLVRK